MRTYLKTAMMSCIVVASLGALPAMTASAKHHSNDTDERLQRLEDIEEIKELKHRYGVALDGIFGDPSGAGAFVDLFVNNLQVDYDIFGTFTTKATLTTFLQTVIAPSFSWGFHVVQNSRIEVNGDVAFGEWYLTAQVVYTGGTEVVPFYGRYVDKYVRTNNGWKIKSSTLVFDPPPVP